MFTLLSEKYLATFAFLSQRNVMSACSALRLLCVCVIWFLRFSDRMAWNFISPKWEARYLKDFLECTLKAQRTATNSRSSTVIC